MIENAAREPEIGDVAACLNKMGAKITGAGTSRIVVEGVAKLHGARHRVLPDRIEAGTYAMAAAMAGGDVLLESAGGTAAGGARRAGAGRRDGRRTNRGHPGPPQRRRPDAGRRHDRPVPGLPDRPAGAVHGADDEGQGHSHITETIFENRFMHVQELARLGARIRLDGEPPPSKASTSSRARR